jgi:competence protein ComEC
MRIPFYIRNALILVTIVAYGMICGMDSSVLRAVIVGSISLLALFRGKSLPIWRLLSAAFVLMLLINPYYLVYDVGFLLSFGAVTGIVWFAQSSKKLQADSWWQQGLGYVRSNYLLPSIAASLGVYPIIMARMGKMNLLSVLGNLLVLPIIPLVMIYGFISLLAYHRR